MTFRARGWEMISYHHLLQSRMLQSNAEAAAAVAVAAAVVVAAAAAAAAASFPNIILIVLQIFLALPRTLLPSQLPRPVAMQRLSPGLNLFARAVDKPNIFRRAIVVSSDQVLWRLPRVFTRASWPAFPWTAHSPRVRVATLSPENRRCCFGGAFRSSMGSWTSAIHEKKRKYKHLM